MKKITRHIITMILFVLLLSMSVSAASVTVKNMKSTGKNTYSVSGTATTDYIRAKIVLDKAASLKVNAWHDSEYSSTKYMTNVKLLNNKGALLDPDAQGTRVGYNSYTTYYLPKGTYYIEFSNFKGKKFTVKAKLGSASDKAGSKKSKAKELTNKKTIKGKLRIGEGADWYKYTAKKAGYHSVEYNYYGHGTITITVYGPKLGKNGEVFRISPYDKQTMNSSGKFSKGTYYFKVSRNDKNANGEYSIKSTWK